MCKLEKKDSFLFLTFLCRTLNTYIITSLSKQDAFNFSVILILGQANSFKINFNYLRLLSSR